jgi:hypothetical protein
MRGIEMKRILFLLGVLFALTASADVVTDPGRTGIPAVNQRVIASGSSDTAALLDTIILWNSSSGAAKAQTIQNCASNTNKHALLIGDEAQTAGTYPITITPTAGTVNNLASIPIASNGGFVSLICDGANTNWVVTYLSTGAAVTAPQGRLSLVTATPVMTTTQSAKGTLYYTAYKGGGKVPYYNGAFDAQDTIPNNEVSTAMATTSTGVLSALNVFDVWWSSANHNICIATNGSGGGWASDTGGSNTARGTGYSQLDTTSRPYATNKNAITHCYNGATDYGAVAANALTYLGTIKTDASSAGKVNWIFGGTASGGTAGEFGVCNYYNPVPVGTQVLDSATSWTYNTATWRAFDGSGTGSGLNNRVTWVSCNGEDAVIASFLAGTAAGRATRPGRLAWVSTRPLR